MIINYIFPISSFILGAVVGSFLNVCIYRLPRGESLVFPSSRCISCNRHIPFYLNIPIISYLMLRGRCFNCKNSFSIDYLLVEIISALLSVFIYLKFGISINFIFIFIFVMSLIVISFIDIEHMIIPDVITYPGIIIGLVYSILNTDFRTAQILIENINLDFLYLIYVADEISVVSSILGILLGGGSLLLIGFVYKIVRKTDGLGLGDVKLLAMIGAFLGWRSIIFVALVSSLVGTIIGLSIILYNKNGLKYAIPFGPFLSFAAALYCFSSDLSLDYFLD